MMMFNAEIAGHVITVDNKFDYIRDYYTGYITEKPSEFTVSASVEEIEAENVDGLNWNAAYLETLAIYRKICERLLEYDMVLFHSSALSFDGDAVLFTAPSGTGKSTHSRLWREYFGDRVTMVNDDKPILHITDKITVFGTPYGGKDNLQSNTSAPVKAIVILHQAKENSLKRLEPNEAFPTLLSQTYRVSSIEGMTKTMPLVGRLSHLPVYSLGCTISYEAVELIHNEIFNS